MGDGTGDWLGPMLVGPNLVVGYLEPRPCLHVDQGDSILRIGT